MTLNSVVGVLNLLLSLLTLGIVLRFWWRHRTARFARAWWVLAIAFGIFAVSETLGAAVLIEARPGSLAFSLTIRVLFMAVLIAGLYSVFEDVLEGQQRALSEAQNTIRLQAEIVQGARETEILARVVERLAASLDLETVMQALCKEVRELTSADSVSVRLPDAERAVGGFRFAVDFASALKSRPARLDQQIDELCAKVVLAGRPAIISEAKSHPLFGPGSPEWLGSLGAFPLRTGAGVVGVLTVVFDEPNAIDKTNQRLLGALADHAAVAVRNAQLHESLAVSARTDGLTGLANRRSFNETLTAEIRRARRYDLPLSVIMADVDGLKAVNDRYGHLAGDTLLNAMAQALRNVVRATDVAARFGGDEFAVILPETTPEDADRIAQRIREEAARLAFDWNGDLVAVSITLGVSGGKGDGLPDVAALLAEADAALYRERQPRPDASPSSA